MSWPKWSIEESGLGHRTLVYEGLDGMHRYQCSPFEFVVLREILELKATIGIRPPTGKPKMCTCGHVFPTHQYPDIQVGGGPMKLGCFILGCRCQDFTEVQP